MSAPLKLVDSTAMSDSPAVDKDELERVALVTGASSGIGLALVNALLDDGRYKSVFAGCRAPQQCFSLRDRAAEDPRLRLLQVDVTDDASVQRAADKIGAAGQLDVVINTVGILHSPDGMRPEKRVSDINAQNLLLAYDVNALGAMRLAIALEPLLKSSPQPRFVSLSARVGSIQDNRLGGWYAYRASKAALNMLLKTLSIEWARQMPELVCATLHPGTVSTALSDPYKSRTKHQVFTPAQAAKNLLQVLHSLTPEQNGRFFAWDGQEIPW